MLRAVVGRGLNARTLLLWPQLLWMMRCWTYWEQSWYRFVCTYCGVHTYQGTVSCGNIGTALVVWWGNFRSSGDKLVRKFLVLMLCPVLLQEAVVVRTLLVWLMWYLIIGKTVGWERCCFKRGVEYMLRLHSFTATSLLWMFYKMGHYLFVFVEDFTWVLFSLNSF